MANKSTSEAGQKNGSSFTHADLVAQLREKQGERTIAEFAEEIGISGPMLSNVLCGYRRLDGPKSRILKFLKMRKVVLFERV